MHSMYSASEGVCIETSGCAWRPEQLRAFHANGAVAKRCAFGGAADDTDVLGHSRCFERLVRDSAYRSAAKVGANAVAAAVQAASAPATKLMRGACAARSSSTSSRSPSVEACSA